MAYLEVIVLLLLFDPVEGLLLRINAERKSGALCREDAVLDRELIWRQTLGVPPGAMQEQILSVHRQMYPLIKYSF